MAHWPYIISYFTSDLLKIQQYMITRPKAKYISNLFDKCLIPFHGAFPKVMEDSACLPIGLPSCPTQNLGCSLRGKNVSQCSFNCPVLIMKNSSIFSYAKRIFLIYFSLNCLLISCAPPLFFQFVVFILLNSLKLFTYQVY